MVPLVGYQRFPVDPGPHLDLLEDRQPNHCYISQGIVDEIFCPLSVDPLEKLDKKKKLKKIENNRKNNRKNKAPGELIMKTTVKIIANNNKKLEKLMQKKEALIPIFLLFINCTYLQDHLKKNR